ncbi:hypothetical protein ACJX0J_009986 [Zea mays]
MKGLFWNSRGLSDLAKIRYISDAVKEHNLEFVILFGILMPQCSICLLFNKLDKFNWILMAHSLPNWNSKEKNNNSWFNQEDFFDKVDIPQVTREENNILSRPFSEKEIKDFYQKYWDIIKHTTRANMEGQVGGAHNMKLPRAIFPLRYLGIPIHYRNIPMYMIIGPC